MWMHPRQRGQGTCSTQVSFTCYHSTHLKGGVGCGALGCIDRTGNERCPIWKGVGKAVALATRPTTSPEKQSDNFRNSCRFWDILDTFCQRFVPFAIRIEAGSQWIAFLSLRRRWLETEAFHVPG